MLNKPKLYTLYFYAPDQGESVMDQITGLILSSIPEEQKAGMWFASYTKASAKNGCYGKPVPRKLVLPFKLSPFIKFWYLEYGKFHLIYSYDPPYKKICYLNLFNGNLEDKMAESAERLKQIYGGKLP